MQALIDGDVWFGHPSKMTLTYDPSQVDALPRWYTESELIDPLPYRGIAAWYLPGNGVWMCQQIDALATIVRCSFTPRAGREVCPKPWWWVDDPAKVTARLHFPEMM